ncbi:hypothetical protein LJC56_02570 [Christensenellaceae bacterium OttesenSCG-928-K19]|nr:hypothetical protein [Christensenellaceae bacterium OttesenSCG-928-K19]
MSKAKEFIQKHGMEYNAIKIEEQIATYLDEMQKGLDGQESSLLMLPSYLQLREDVQKNKKVICIDAGGTNLRIALTHFDDEGNFQMGKLERQIMPGVKEALDAQQFFDALAGYIAHYCAKSKEIVMSFAYRAKSTPEIDAELIEITKEVQVKGEKGKQLGAEIKKSLEKMGVPGVKVIIINDSVATALAGKAERLNYGYGAFTGTILGTGSNSCYLESNAKIGKISGYPKDGVMVINTEAGSYSRLPRSDIDFGYDATTIHPEIGIAEKMTSGAYLGALCEYTLDTAADEGVFRTRGVKEITNLTTRDVSEYLMDGSGIIAEHMLSDEDDENARELLQNIVLRAARVAALQMAAVAEKSFKTNNKLCMTIEGTTYEKMPGLKEELHQVLMAYLRGRGYEPDIISIDHAVLKGCAIAGLSR